MDIENSHHGHLVRRYLTKLIVWAQSNSIQPLLIGNSCCAEKFNFHRSDSLDCLDPNVSPAAADLLIITGSVSNKMVPSIKNIYNQMPAPGWVMALGACAVGGAIFESYATVRDLNSILPVDIYIPGCPPDPETLLDGFDLLREKISKEKLARQNVSAVKQKIGNMMSWFEDGK